jgi:hypothetical protein
VANNSDFKRPFSDLFELLPDVYQSQTNESVFRNVFNRYLSKPEIERVNGIIGQATGATGDRRLVEPTPHRQAYQLQPLLFTRIGGENYITSYVDILNELERLGVITCRQPLWGNALKFNWIPPVDIDKLVNFRNYYWVDPVNPSASPQYITIKDPCTQAEQLVEGYQYTLDTYGEEFSIQAIDATNNTFVISGDISEVFVEDFVFLVRESTNTDINQKNYTTISSTYDDDADETTISVAETITLDTPVDGVISIVEQKFIYLAEQNCVCGGDVGWDQAPWDDSDIGDVLWTDGLLTAITHPTEADWITANGAPAVDDIWYDTTTNTLKQYDGAMWNIVQQNFSALLSLVEGTHYWDFTEGCAVEENQWIEQNKWVHKNNVTNFATAKQAVQPIIEYDPTLQLNKWNFVEQVWQYRSSQFFDFEDTDLQPTLNELIPFNYVIDVGLTEISFSPEYGDQTSSFVPGSKFRILGDTIDPGNDDIYTVQTSVYQNGETVVTIDSSFSSATDSLTSGGVVTPDITSQGDPWRLYDEHWILTDNLEPVPVTPRTENPYLEIDDLGAPIPLVGIGEYLTSEEVDPTAYAGPGTEYIYAMEITVTNAGGVTAGTTFNFDSRMVDRARVGANDIRVYVDGIRQYGQFVEIDNDTNDFVDGIEFDYDIPVNAVVLIEAGPPALEDIGRYSIDVLTESGVVTQSMIRYRRSEQVKTEVNQYPLFDVVNLDGTDAFMANHIFGYVESQDAPIDAQTSKRIVVGENDDYHFEQLVLEEDNGTMYAFILGGETQTIWRKGNNDEEYIPEYVDANREMVSVGDPDGFWEIPDQLYFNSEHENRREVTFRELFSHFTSIIGEQANIPGFVLPGDTYYLLLDPNYGLGGKIKEHNDSYDTMLSSIYVNNVTPLGVIDFAHDAYLNSLNTLKETYRNNLVNFLLNVTPDYLQDLAGSITEQVITSYELNDALAYIYNDSNTYDSTADAGVKNWPATLPFVRMAFKEVPYTIEDDELDLRYLVHHDGHYSTPALTATTIENVIQTTINTSDTRVSPAEPFGLQSTSAPPSTYSALQTEMTPRTGVYWYQVTGGVRTLYRFNVVSIGINPPVGVSEDAYWYDTDTDTLRQLSGALTWDPVTVVGDEVITAAWEEVNLNDILTDLLLEVETRLYEVAPNLDELAYDVDALATSTVSCPDNDPVTTEEDTFNTYLQEAFGSWLNDQEIDDPFSASNFYDPLDPFTWNYKQSILTYPNGVVTGASGGWWKDLYQKIYRTPYPHLEPWKLQGYDEKPSWWDAQYLDTSGTRRWIYDHGTTTGMWENIRTGVVPAGELLPNGSVSTGASGEAGLTYNFFSVNIDDVTIDGYQPDDLFPPFWDHLANGGSAVVRTVISSFGSVVNPSADYQFGDRGPVEFDWTQTAQRLYDDLTIGFKMQPVRFMHHTFGEEFIEVGGLQVSPDLNKVYSHKDVRFHGDIVNTNELLQFEGLNQWYVNFNRSAGFDTTSSNFRPLWQNWSPMLTYQFGSVIDTDTFQIDNPNFDLNRRDYRIALKRSIGIDNKTFEGLKISVLGIPNKLVSTDTESLWTFQYDTFSPIKQTLQYYNVKNYPFNVDSLNNTFTIYQFRVVDIDQLGGTFTVAGNQTEAFLLSNDFSITKSTGNNGSYTATSVVYDSVQNTTHITVGAALPDSTADGVLTAQYREIPWEVGDQIELTSTGNLPSPLRANTVYYVVPVTTTTFRLARTKNDAITGNVINVDSGGSGIHSVGEILYKFKTFDGNSSNDRTWIHYKLDKDSVLSITPPTTKRGIQNLINVVDGYAEFERDEGFVFNADGSEIDVDLNKPISWQTELERFLDSIYRIRSFRQEQGEQFNVNTNPLDDELVFVNEQPNWVTGQKVQILSYDGVVPTPLIQQAPYYLIRNEADRVQLALTRTDALLGNAIDILTTGTGRVFLQQYTEGKRTVEVFELNPSRNSLWVNHPQGILSDIDVGSTVDIRNTQLITDQNGEKLTTEELAVFRQDKQSRIFVQNPSPDPTKPANTQNVQRDWRHISTANVFIDGVEHVIMFNDDSVEGFLIYDPFLGLNTNYFEVLFFRQDEFTQRPIVGGYFLTSDEQLLRNIEASVLDLQNAYDTYQTLETTDLVKEGRRSLGYKGINSQSYLTELNVSPKTQFAFWRGFIQHKGSTIGLDAYVNSSTFGGAEVDEYWAFKVADYGSAYEQETLELNLTEQDGQRVEKRFEFLDGTMVRTDADDTFEGVFITDESRWNNQPAQLALLANNNNTLYFEAEITSVESFTSVTVSNGDYFYEPAEYFDDVVILRVDPGADTYVELTQGVDYNVVNSKLVQFTSDPIPALGFGEEYRIYTINPAKSKLNPAKIVDTADDIVINDVPVWDPRRGHQYHTAYNVVNLETADDPAVYNTSLDAALIADTPWAEPEVGQVWWDTSHREYIPYHDKRVFNLESRSQNWGRLSEWADVTLYQWTESDLPPAEWDAQAAIETTDITIDPRVRKSGTAKVDIFHRTRETLDINSVVVSNAVTDANKIFINDPAGEIAIGDRVVFTTSEELPAPLENGTFYYVIETEAASANRGIRVSLTEGGSVVEIQPGAATIDINDVAVTGTEATGLTNDFDTAGYQEVDFTVSKTAGSATGLATGTSGYDRATFSVGLTNGTPTGLSAGTAGSWTVDYSGSLTGGTASGLAATFYSQNIVIDGNTYPVYIFDGSAVPTINDVLNTINSALGGVAAATLSGGDILITSLLSTGPSSTVVVQATGPFGSPIFQSLTSYNSLGSGTPGSSAPNFSANITVDGGSPQLLQDSGTNLQTMQQVLDLVNSTINGVSASLVGNEFRITSDSTGNGSTVLISDVDLFSSMTNNTSTSSPIGGTSTDYFAEIAVDGVGSPPISIAGDDAQTFGELITQLNLNISGATASLFGGNIRITSNSTGSSSTIDISKSPPAPDLFQSLSNYDDILAAVDGVDATAFTATIDTGFDTTLVSVIGNQAQTYRELVDIIASQLPATTVDLVGGNIVISAGNNTVSISEPTTNKLFSSLLDFQGIFNSDTGEGSHELVPPFRNDWVQLVPNVQRQIAARDRVGGAGSTTYSVQTGVPSNPNDVSPGDEVDVYVNGFLSEEGLVVDVAGNIDIANPLNDEDFITIVKPVDPLTTEEATFDPDVFDDGSNLVQRKEDYNYTVRNTIDEFGQTTQTYFFWVQDKTTRNGDYPSLAVAERELANIPTPYIVFDKLIEDGVSAGSAPIADIPLRYTQAIIRGLAGIINDDRYILRFTRDFTLRDQLMPRNYPADLPADFSRVKQEPLDLKNLHAEWTLLREGQPFKVTRTLWDKVTESIIGRKLDNPAVRVPSLDRELYDARNGTQTQYGFGSGQAFVSGELAFATILDDLQDPDNNFAPVDINAFFTTHDTETETGLIEFMDDIYNNFNVVDVNRIYFKILLDALSTKDKYPDVFKTSWVALEGTQVLQTEAIVNG